MKKVLIIEDDAAINELLGIHLEIAGYSVSNCSTISEAQGLIQEKPSIIILDLGLPDGDGKALIPEIKEREIPIIILTARKSLTEKVKGLNQGADDYMEKPFESVELIARIKAILRRTSSDSEEVIIDNTEINLLERKAIKDNSNIMLTSKEWELLEYFIFNRGFLLSREQLLQSIWGQDYFGTTRTVDVHVQKLRQKMGLTSITTLYKQGYRLEK